MDDIGYDNCVVMSDTGNLITLCLLRLCGFMHRACPKRAFLPAISRS